MKKLGLVVLVSMALLTLEMTSCVSYPKLDLSTLDRSQPIQVSGIYLNVLDWSSAKEKSAKFFATYGENLRKPSGEWQGNEADVLLEALGGTVAVNWNFITDRVKAETGITLQGDRFMQDVKDGNSTRIQGQIINPGKNTQQYFYALDYAVEVEAVENVRTTAVIKLVWDTGAYDKDNTGGKVIPFDVTISQYEEGELGTVENERRAVINLR